MTPPPVTLEDGRLFYRLLFETNPQPALIFDRGTLVILAANAAAEQHYGYGAEELLQKTIGDLSPLDELPRFLDMLRRIPPEAGPSMRSIGAFQHRLKSGRLIDVEIAAGRLVLDGKDAFLALVSDVTERTLAEKALWESTAHLRKIVTSAPIILWSVDRKGVFTLSEGSGLSSLGLKAGEVVGRSLVEVYGDHPHIPGYVSRAFAGESFSERVQVGELAYQSFYSPLRGDDGAILGVVGVALDVTDRQRAEEALRHSEARFEKAFQASPAALTISTVAEGRYLFVNDAYLRLLGYSREELIGHEATEFPFWPSAAARDAAVALLRRDGALRDFPLAVKTKTGETLDLIVSLELVEIDGQSCLLGMSHDVTARLRAERALEEQRAFLRQVIDINPSQIFAKDREGRFTLANQAAADVHGTTVEALVGRSDHEFALDADEVAAFHRDDLEVMDTRREKFIPEEVLTDLQGDRRWLQTVKRPIVGADGVANQVLGVAMDITARKHAEEALRDAAQLSREIVSSADDGIFVCDANLKYQVWNRALEELTGTRESEVLGRSARDINPDFDDESVVPLLRQALEGEKVDAPDVAFGAAKGRRARWLSRKYRPLRNAKGKIVGVVGVVRDVTDRRRR